MPHASRAYKLFLCVEKRGTDKEGGGGGGGGGGGAEEVEILVLQHEKSDVLPVISVLD